LQILDVGVHARQQAVHRLRPQPGAKTVERVHERRQHEAEDFGKEPGHTQRTSGGQRDRPGQHHHDRKDSLGCEQRAMHGKRQNAESSTRQNGGNSDHFIGYPPIGVSAH
jgi:hypothetical protein